MKIIIKSILSLFICTLYTYSAFSQESVIIRNSDTTIKAGKHIEYFEDNKDFLPLAEIKKVKQPWKRSKSNTINIGYSSSTYWFRLKLWNETGERCYLIIDRPMIDHIEMFISYKNNDKRIGTVGDIYPFSKRLINDNNFILPIEKNFKNATIYLKIKTTSRLSFEPVLFSNTGMITSFNTDFPLMWIFYGILIIIFIYNFILWILTLDINYILLAALIISWFMFHLSRDGFAFMYLWPNIPYLNSIAVPLFAALPLLILGIFLQVALKLKENYRRLYFLVFTYTIPAILGVFLSIFFGYSILKIIMALLLYSTIINITITVYIASKKDRTGILFLISLLPLYITATIALLETTGLVKFNILSKWGWRYGTALTITLLAVTLADNISILKKNLQKNQQKLNNSINELNAANEELAATNEELQASNEEMEAQNEAIMMAQEEIIESEERYRILIDNLPTVIWITNNEGKTSFISSNIEDIYGYTPQEIYEKGEELFFKRIHPDDVKIVRQAFDKLFNDDIDYDVEYRIQKKDGQWIWLHDQASIKYQRKGEHIAYGLFSDITERKNTEDIIKNSLKEKELLLKEIHHRVKNNMQIISSLMSLQDKYLNDEKDRELFIESQNRIRSMALVHEKIYQSDNLSDIDMGTYINDIIIELINAYKIAPDKIGIDTDIQNIQLGLDSAIPCSLIINELITNILKHAFPEEKSGTITVVFSHKDNDYTLVISDDGIGVPDIEQITEGDSLGLKLVDALISQIKGKLTISNTDGLTYTIQFST